VVEPFLFTHLDVMMPGMNGYELLTALRSDPTTQTIPVILVSALAGEASVEGKCQQELLVKRGPLVTTSLTLLNCM